MIPVKPLVIEYLKTHSFEELNAGHGVNHRFSKDRSKVTLNYDQLLVKSGDPVAEQCRGLIVRPPVGYTSGPVGECELVAWPMDRFYNEDDPAAAKVDWSDPRLKVQEKLDGTMIVFYFDKVRHKWCAGTRGVPEADVPICENHIEIGDATFSELFFGVLVRGVFPFNRNYTYVFELTGPHNRVVVDYHASNITLLAVRSLETGLETHTRDIQFAVPREWPVGTASALRTFVDTFPPSECEGAVVVDSQFRRVKVKSKAYVMASRSKESVVASKRSALVSILEDTIDDVYPLLSKSSADSLRRFQEQVRVYVTRLDDAYHACLACAKHGEGVSRKDFAEQVKASGVWMAPLFALFDERAPTALEWIRAEVKSGRLSVKALDTIVEEASKV